MLTRAIGRAARAKPGRAVAQVSPRASEFITWSDTSNRWYTSVIGPPRHRHAFHGNPYQLGVASSSRTGYAGWYVGKGKEVDTRPVQGHSRSVQVLYGGEGAGKDARRVQEPSNSSNNAYGTRQQTRLFHFSTTALRGEGKGPDTRLVQACQGPSYSADAHGAGLQRRRFHSSARRDALPLIPAGAAILKSTSLLAIITTISRIIISFFPLGTIAAFRNARIARWASDEGRRPITSDEAQEFFQMWCQGEKAIKLTKDDVQACLEGDLQPDGSILTTLNRKAWAHPTLPGGFRRDYKKYLDPKVLRTDKDMQNRPWYRSKFIRATRFYMPPLPPASERYYSELDPAVQGEVDALRRYWISLRAIKDDLRLSRIIVGLFLILPCVLLIGVYATALERVPFTGRWRIILLTPDEEDAISNSLSGTNWYQSVINLLTTPEAPAPPIVPFTDWRWTWVEGVLRRLEKATIQAALADSDSHSASQPRYWSDTHNEPRPPSSKYPLRPRPRVSSRLHSALPGGEPSSGKEHLELGPPYSLMLMDKDERNAFSYGFGGKGAGGVVVFTGLLDDILSRGGRVDEAPPVDIKGKDKGRGGIFGRLFSSPESNRPVRTHDEPTEEQTLHLACVLAHEMGHLLLAHHLETLSQQQVLWPSLLGLSMDLIRAFIWPFTIFLGPAVNDALANMGRTSSEELANKYGEIGFQWMHEYEADLVGLRILSHAGFSTRKATAYFAQSIPDLHEIKPLEGTGGTTTTVAGGGKREQEGWTEGMFKLWTRATHPSREARLGAVRAELERWGRESEQVRNGREGRGGE